VSVVCDRWLQVVISDDDFSKELKKAKDRVKDERRNDKKRSRSVLDTATLSKQHQIVSFTCEYVYVVYPCTYDMCM